jgi:RNA polymerase sigma-70 factor (ECF subfamily)
MQTMLQLNDQQLIELFLKGKEEALQALINKYKDRVYTSIYLIVKDKYLAEDIFQDTFLKAIQTIRNGKYNEQGMFLAWLMRISHNLCVDHFRKIKKMPGVTTADGQDIFALLPFTDQNVEDKIMRRQSHERVRKMLEFLPEEQREVVILRIFSDLSFKEIAALTNVSINTALGRMRYGLINLRKLMLEKQITL